MITMLTLNHDSCYNTVLCYFLMEPRDAVQKNRMGDRWRHTRKNGFKIFILTWTHSFILAIITQWSFDWLTNMVTTSAHILHCRLHQTYKHCINLTSVYSNFIPTISLNYRPVWDHGDTFYCPQCLLFLWPLCRVLLDRPDRLWQPQLSLSVPAQTD